MENQSGRPAFVTRKLTLWVAVGLLALALILLRLFLPGIFSVFVVTLIILITVFLVVLAASPYIRLWRAPNQHQAFPRFEWEGIDKSNLKDATSYHQSLITVVLIVGRSGWGAYTWFLQDQNYRASQVPAIEVRISAISPTKVSPQNQEDFLSQDKDLKDKAKVRLIEGTVSIKNVGTSQTSVQLCECVRPGKDGAPDVFVRACAKPKDWKPVMLCGENPREQSGGEAIVAKGPIVVSKVYLRDEDKMKFVQAGRFWLTRFSVDNRPDLVLSNKIGLQSPDMVLTDEMRPKAEDKFEFLVTVSEPGLYAVMFTSPLDKKESNRMKDAGYEMPVWQLRWYATTFVDVK